MHSAAGSMELRVEATIARGELVILYGKSGAGKTSLLRILAGLLTPESGTITCDGQPWFNGNDGTSVSPRDREVGFVFQDYALFPNMTVRQNLEFALRFRHDRELVDDLMEVVGMQTLADRKPAALSGGQQQRVALARAIARRPKLLLLDEPLAALDAELRLSLQSEILLLHKRFGLTTIMVTHDVAEVVRIADRVLHLDHGAVVRSGKPRELFLDNKVSGKFKFVGEILSLEKSDVVVIVSVRIGADVVKVVATDEEARAFRVGDRVMVSSKAFNPIISKIEL